MSTTSSSYFATIRPAEGLCVQEFLDALTEFLNRNSKCFVLAKEKISFQSHVHFVFITREPRRRDSVKRSLTGIASKFYLKFQIDLKVALTEGAVYYTIKDQNILAELFPEEIYKFIDDDYSRSLRVVEENKQYKDTRLKFAYDNKQTWEPYFIHYVSKHGMVPRLSDFERWIYNKGGQPAPSHYKCKFYFDGYAGKTSCQPEIVPFDQKLYEKIFEEGESSEEECSPPSKKRRLASESSASSE